MRSLSCGHCHVVTVRQSLSGSHCQAVTVRQSLSHGRCHTVAVMQSLSHGCCQAVTQAVAACLWLLSHGGHCQAVALAVAVRQSLSGSCCQVVTVTWLLSGVNMTTLQSVEQKLSKLSEIMNTNQKQITMCL